MKLCQWENWGVLMTMNSSELFEQLCALAKLSGLGGDKDIMEMIEAASISGDKDLIEAFSNDAVSYNINQMIKGSLRLIMEYSPDDNFEE